MKKAFKRKLSGSKKLVRKVLSRSSLSTNINETGGLEEQEKVMVEAESALTQEIEALQDQIGNLKAAILALQEDTEYKEVALAKLAREKEKIYQDLVKQKRTNVNLIQQLEDERKFYYKEKELYCHEMNEFKKLKRVMSNSTTSGEEKNIPEYKQEIFKLKQTLNHTLEANYNLSVKFLRMKNTKTCMKTELRKMKLDHDKLVNDLKNKIENLSSEMTDMVEEKLNTLITPSSRKYLQLVKQNSCLVYENLCLQLEVDKLNIKFDKFKIQQTKSETNSRLKYIKHSSDLSERPRELSPKRRKNRTKHVRISVDAPEKLEKPSQPSCSHHHNEQEIIKIFERHELPGTPTLEFLDEDDGRDHRKKPSQKQESTTVRFDSDFSETSKITGQGKIMRVQSDPEIASSRFSKVS